MIPNLTIDLTSTMAPVFAILSGVALAGLAVLLAVMWRDARAAARQQRQGTDLRSDEAA